MTDSDRWNARNETGVIVDVTKDDDSVLRTRTRSYAFGTVSGDDVIMVNGIRGWYLLDRVKRVPYPKHEPVFRRPSGDVLCEMCGKKYYDHPEDLDHPSYTGMPFLVKLCDGSLVKL